VDSLPEGPPRGGGGSPERGGAAHNATSIRRSGFEILASRSVCFACGLQGKVQRARDRYRRPMLPIASEKPGLLPGKHGSGTPASLER
jgi:hypothetical protein